ncbi:unnamed protein product [Agarophyton chilense]
MMSSDGLLGKPPTTRICVVGGGISGICAARACLLSGLNVTLFEKRSKLGGIWSLENSPVFDSLSSNTATFEAGLSDIPPLRVFPSSSLGKYDDLCCTSQEMADYIQLIVKKTPRFFESTKLKTNVLSVTQTPSKTYCVSFLSDGTRAQESEFDKVIISTGYFNTPFVPPASELPGIDKYRGKVLHVSMYKNPSQLKGKHVLIVGGSVSGCEAAGDMLAFASSEGPTSVTLNTRSMRFLLLKQHKGEVLLSKLGTRFQRFRDLAGRFENEQYSQTMSSFIPQFLSNSDYPAPEPDGPIKIPYVPSWVPVSGKLYEACQKKKLQWKVSSLECITENGVRFRDGTEGEYDVIVFATGYRLHLPFLEKDVQQTICAGNGVNLLDLYDYTFHPEVPNMAFVGMFSPATSIIPIVDNQSRWVARVFNGDVQLPSDEELNHGVQLYRQTRSSPNSRFVVHGFDVLDVFAKHGDFEVNLAKFPQLCRALLFGPMIPAQFRLFGSEHSEEALEETMKQFEAAGFKIGDNVVSSEIYEELRTICHILDEKGICPSSLPVALGHLVVSKT